MDQRRLLVDTSGTPSLSDEVVTQVHRGSHMHQYAHLICIVKGGARRRPVRG